MRFKNKLIALLSVLFLVFIGGTQVVMGAESVWLLDETGLVSNEVHDEIARLNEDVLKTHSIEPQLGIEVRHSLPDGYYDIDEYRAQRFEELGIGAAGVDSGILYILLLEDREFAIETGYGVEHILTDLEASRILNGKMKDHLIAYSETGNPEHVDGAVMQTASEIHNLLEKADSGLLFEEREELEKQRVAAAQARAESSETFNEFILKFSLSILFGIPGVFLLIGAFASISEKRKKAKNKAHLKAVSAEFDAYFQENDLPFINEVNAAQFKHFFTEKYKGRSEHEIKAALQNKEELIHEARVGRYNSNIIKLKDELKHPVEFYLEQKDKFVNHIKGNPSYALAGFIRSLDYKYKESLEMVETKTIEFKELIDKYLNERNLIDDLSRNDIENEILTKLKKKYKLTHKDVLQGNVVAFTLEGVEKDIESMYVQVYVKKKINDEKLHLDDVYGGSQSDFNKYVEREVSKKTKKGQSIDDIVKLIVGGTLFYNLYDTYKTLREKEYQEVQREKKKREAKIRRTNEKERVERAKRQAILAASSSKSSTSTSRNSTSSSSNRSSTSFGSTSSSSRRSSSSFGSSSSRNRRPGGGGGFGSGFGGGRSGGGGSSGGW